MLHITFRSVYRDVPKTNGTLRKLTKLDAYPDVLLFLIAHSVPGVTEEPPSSLSAWRKKCWKNKLVRPFLERGSKGFSNRSSPIDSKKIQGGCSGFLRQEFRELELLDDITTQQYHGLMPITVTGNTRYALIESLRHHVGCEYMPPRLDSVLAWSNVDTLDSADASDFAWTKKLITHFPILERPPPEHPPSKVSNSLDKQSKRVFTPMKPAEKRKGRISDTFDAKQEGTQKRANDSVTRRDFSMHLVPIGCKWSNNSCAYDATMFVLFNMWNANHAGLASDVEAIGNEWLQLVMRSFRTFKDGLYTLEKVRDHTRRKLHRDFPTVFVYGRETSAEAVMLKMMTSPTVFASIAVCCDNGVRPRS
ncbi:hypothetical protein ARMGADRAFT_1070728 [Armillaria gallica]|uniref:Uncharacterized protein n=1 Tax=Armillaria gallica TaxID=47427 RepID=A0A2H3EA12_ARMGA|nr:hypothetical protein ARMGADRAFT_1070728 [Armillaria gallica]